MKLDKPGADIELRTSRLPVDVLSHCATITKPVLGAKLLDEDYKNGNMVESGFVHGREGQEVPAVIPHGSSHVSCS